MSYDSEFEKMIMADKCRHEKIHGFQGCKNYGKGCDFGGYYLAQYSPEGLCDACERTAYPERFNGCACCRRPQKNPGFCMECRMGISEWLFHLFYNKNPKSKTTSSCYITGIDETNDWKLGQIISIGTHSVCSNYDEKLIRSAFAPHSHLERWPGFFAGGHRWFIPKITDKFQIDISDINWDNKNTVILRELEKNGIFLYEEIQFRDKN